MRICIDLDGVICNLKKDGQSYHELLPVEGAVEKLKEFQNAGHYIIINTARHMKTCGANIGLVNSRISLDTLTWLQKFEVPFDEIYFGKPWAEIYIDDNAFRFTNWKEINNDASNLPSSSESKLK
jgi:capsule biosynthesis phosphatase